jgi:signal transduction histidine kinase
LLDREPVDLAKLLREVADRYGAQLERSGSTLAIEGADTLIGSWDESRLDQVVTNLISNAIKYGRGGPITVRVSAAGEKAVLAISDCGIGIPADRRDLIFQRFGRAVSEREYSGFGLGLWISREIVEGLGGRIGVDSVAGVGSTFTVELPLAPQ